MMKAKVVYSEKYRKVFLREPAWPILNHVANGTAILNVEILELDKLGDETEYQIIRLILKPPEK